MGGTMRVLVTGGAGFIGSHVVDRLLAAGHRPVVFDLRPSSYHDVHQVDAVVGDIGDLDALSRAMTCCDAVIHLAAAADVNEVEAAPLDAEQRNAGGTARVLEAARRTGVARVIYASTIWVYSDTPAALLEESVPLAPPAHLYTATKLAGELYCRSYQQLYGIEYTILRFGIPYGPRARPAAVIPAFVRRALAGEPLIVAGDGRQSRRFVYVEDLADGIVRALAPAAANRVYNLVGAEDVTIAEVAHTVRDLLGDVELVWGPGRTGDFAGAPASGDRAADELNWRPETPFREGVRRYVEWHRANAAVAPPEISEPRAVAALLRRAAAAVTLAAVGAAFGIGIATLAPAAPEIDRYDTFTALLVLLLPLVLAAGFDWDTTRRRWLQIAFWTLAAGALAVLVLPSPPIVDRLGHPHPVLLTAAVVSAATAALLVRTRPPLRISPAAARE
jgi:UDP-glucose 4-epimerase